MNLTDTVKRTAAGGAALLATLTVRKALRHTWRATTDHEPPDAGNPRRSGFGEALLWTAISAAAIAATQLIVRRGIESSMTG